MPLAFSYIRFSSSKQAKGTSLARQLAQSAEIVKKYGLTLDKRTYQDLGVSAFKGANASQGALGAFIQAVQSGAIPSDSWLIVESLDRISRADVTTAQSLFLQLLNLGITIYTCLDCRIYSKSEIDESGGLDLLLSILLFSRSNEESKTKSRRVLLTAQRQIDANLNRKEGEPPTAITAVGQNAWWVKVENKTIIPHPQLFIHAQTIARLALQGYGRDRILKYMREHHSNAQKTWSTGLISNLVNNPACFGLKVIKIGGVEHRIENYYPPILTQRQFYDLKAHRSLRVGSTATKSVPLLSAINILKCGLCGGSMSGALYEQKCIRYVCSNAKTGNCTRWSVVSHFIEDTVLRLCGNRIFRPQSTQVRNEIPGLKNERKEKQLEIDRLVEALADGSSTSVLKIINKKEDELTKIDQRLKAAHEKNQLNEKQTVIWDDLDPRLLSPFEDSLRIVTREKIRKTFKRITVTQVKPRCIAIYMEFITGESLLCYRKPSTLYFDKSAWRGIGDWHDAVIQVKGDEFKHDPKTERLGDNETERFLKENADLLTDDQRKRMKELSKSVSGEREDGFIYSMDGPLPIGVDPQSIEAVRHDTERWEKVVEWARDEVGAPLHIVPSIQRMS